VSAMTSTITTSAMVSDCGGLPLSASIQTPCTLEVSYTLGCMRGCMRAYTLAA
jgi:hypothetical protein